MMYGRRPFVENTFKTCFMKNTKGFSIRILMKVTKFIN